MDNNKIIQEQQQKIQDLQQKLDEKDKIIRELRKSMEEKDRLLEPNFNHEEVRNFAFDIQQPVMSVRKFTKQNEIVPLAPQDSKSNYRAVKGMGMKIDVLFLKTGKNINVKRGLNGLVPFHEYPFYKCK